MLARIPIRWRITLFHIITMLGIGGLMAIGLFAVFGIAVTNAVEQLATSRAIEAARIVETTGTLTETNLIALGRDGVSIIALDAEGRVVTQIGAGVAPGSVAEPGYWQDALATGEGQGGDERSMFTAWDDAAMYTYTEPVHADTPIQVIEAGANYDRVGQSQYMWVTFAFVGFGILAFILITIGSVLLVRYSLAPVTAIAETAAEISAADLSRRLPVRPGRDELGYLAATFNDLLDRIETAFHEREALLESQRRFVADASHELRTPLTSILGYARMLRQWGLEHPEAAAEAVRHMESEARRMESLVEDLLHLARGDEGAPLVRAGWDLCEIAREAIANARPAAPDGVTIDAQLPGEALVAQVDAGGVQQVLGVLLDNALKYTPAGGIVSVSLVREGDDAVFTVADTGPGIPPEHRARVFERFARLEQSRTTRGAGLGLAIAKDIVQRHGGTIDVGGAPGQGARFTIRLPLNPHPDSLPAQPTAHGRDGRDGRRAPLLP